MLSLLFWGLANDTTGLSEAPLLYPLFGIGANAAQSLAGIFLTRMAVFTSAVRWCSPALLQRLLPWAMRLRWHAAPVLWPGLRVYR